MIAVVVPSPAKSFVLVATSWISCAPAFSIAFGSSMARAIVTPSFITLRFPDSDRTTLRPRNL